MFKKIFYSVLVATTVTGCMGRNALTGKVLKLNLLTFENRWGRECLFVGLLPVYFICSFIDKLAINSIEFWSGENPISGESPLVDVPIEEVNKMGFDEVVKSQIERLNEREAKLYLDFVNGDRATFDILRDDMKYTVSYQGVEFYKGTIE